jgi:hypothetical protein
MAELLMGRGLCLSHSEGLDCSFIYRDRIKSRVAVPVMANETEVIESQRQVTCRFNAGDNVFLSTVCRGFDRR